MHEVSLVRALLSQVRVAAGPLSPECVQRVVVSAGPLSGVEPILVHQAFDELKSEAGFAGCHLSIEEVMLEAVCRDCGHTFEVQNFSFRCPQCHSHKVRVTQGDAFRLLRLEVVEPAGVQSVST